jgi:FkbM family methyltransferase
MSIRRKLLSLARRVCRRIERNSARSPYVAGPDWRTVERGELKGVDFFLPKGDGRTWADRIVAGEYESDLFPVFRELAEQGGTLYDIGAHIGYFTCTWVILGGHRVEAFEPVPSNYHIILNTLARNNLNGKVRVHNLALGDFNGEGNLVVNEEDLGTTSMAFVEEIGGVDLQRNSKSYRYASVTTTPVRRLDDLIQEMGLPMPGVLKIDVEGAETSVLSGAATLLIESRPTLLCEVHNIDSGIEITQKLAKLGYELRVLDKKGTFPICMWTPA